MTRVQGRRARPRPGLSLARRLCNISRAAPDPSARRHRRTSRSERGRACGRPSSGRPTRQVAHARARAKLERRGELHAPRIVPLVTLTSGPGRNEDGLAVGAGVLGRLNKSRTPKPEQRSGPKLRRESRTSPPSRSHPSRPVVRGRRSHERPTEQPPHARARSIRAEHLPRSAHRTRTTKSDPGSCSVPACKMTARANNRPTSCRAPRTSGEADLRGRGQHGDMRPW